MEDFFDFFSFFELDPFSLVLDNAGVVGRLVEIKLGVEAEAPSNEMFPALFRDFFFFAAVGVTAAGGIGDPVAPSNAEIGNGSVGSAILVIDGVPGKIGVGAEALALVFLARFFFGEAEKKS